SRSAHFSSRLPMPRSPSFYVPRATPRATLKLCCALSLVLRTAHGVRFQSDASRVPSEVEDPCAGEANETKRMVLALGVWNAGWEGNHCRWPGVVCAPKSCHVRHLKFTGGTGRLPEDMHFPELIALRITLSNVSGDLRSLRHLPTLKFVELTSPAIQGDLAVFAQMRNLRQLHLKSTFVSGDLRVFEKTPKLQLLTLFKTHVRGDLAAFRGTPKLMTLNLKGTHVFGDVAALNTTNAYAVR
ncbi:Receptor-like protein 14 (AtRLP14), partial [Durusdinium trenchii]